MRKDLTIGEAAEILSTSTYNLRYYEKEGIISPSSISENGYRMFTADDIIYIKCVMLLRESGVAIKDIKKLMDNYTQENYVNALKKSYEDVVEKINKLQNLKTELEKSLESAQKDNEGYEIKYIGKRSLVEVKKSDYDMDYSIKEVYDSAQKKNIDKSLICSDEFYYILYDDSISLCVLSDKSDGISFETGNYLCYNFFAIDDDEIDKKINEFGKYIENNKIEVCGEVLIIVSLRTSMNRAEGSYNELQIRIK